MLLVAKPEAEPSFSDLVSLRPIEPTARREGQVFHVEINEDTIMA